MKQLWTFLSTLAAVCINSVKLQDETGRTLYSARYDNLDIDTILASNRLVTNYVDCLLNKKPCPPEGKDLKRILPEALRTKCGRCSNRQKENALKVIRNLYERYPNHYNALREKWDTTGEYHRRFLEYLDEEQFNQIGGNDNFDRDRDQSQINTQSVSFNAIPSTTRQRPTTTTTTTVRSTTTRRVTRPSTTQRRTSSTTTTQKVTRPSTTTTRARPPTTTTRRFFTTTRPPPSTTLTNVPAITNTFVSNRFGDDEPYQPSVRPNPPPTTAQPPPIFRPRPSSASQPNPPQNAPDPTRRVLFPSTHLINNFFVPPNQQGTQGPIAGIINAIGNKVTRTTEAIVGMIHNTARIITGHHQPPNYVN